MHLFRGTQKTNIQDAVSKRRMAHSGKHGRRKLTPELVRIVRGMSFVIITKKEVAAILKINAKSLNDVLSGKNWRYLDAGMPR